MKYTYKEIDLEFNQKIIIRTNDENNLIENIPLDLANSDYQFYLNKDNPDWGKSTIS